MWGWDICEYLSMCQVSGGPVYHVSMIEKIPVSQAKLIGMLPRKMLLSWGKLGFFDSKGKKLFCKKFKIKEKARRDY